ncbi:MAG: hypothetical protein SFX72_08555 [Isosphaeraceae bacterium]|nr:hypothetical protein [Isosphaeraceae bacterium]
MLRRLRLKTFLTIVALIGLSTWVLVDVATDRRRARLRERADSFAFGEADVLTEITLKLAAAREAESNGEAGRARAASLRREAEDLARLATWHVSMERKYAHAVDHPWEAVPADGPPPPLLEATTEPRIANEGRSPGRPRP